MTLKLISFKYQKTSDTSITNRVAFVLSKPSSNYSMLEVDDDCEAEIDEIEMAVKAEFERHQVAMKQLSDKYGLKYKNFTGTNVFDIQEL